MFRVFAAFLVMLLCGCATGAADKDLAFESTSSKAIVVLGWTGLDGWRGLSVGMSFRGVGPDTRLDKRAFFVSNGNGWQAMNPIEYFVVEVDPGSYIANSTVTSNGVQQLSAKFCLGTVRFDAPAGKAVYIGNFAAPKGMGAVTASPPDLEAAKVKLREYSGVKVELTESLMRNSPYPDSECRRGF